MLFTECDLVELPLFEIITLRRVLFSMIWVETSYLWCSRTDEFLPAGNEIWHDFHLLSGRRIDDVSKL